MYRTTRLRSLMAALALICMGNACVSPPRAPQSVDGPDDVAAVAAAPPPTGGSKTLTITSWNVKHLGRKLFDPRQASPLLADADIAAFQEVNSKANGIAALQGIAAQLRALTGEKMCVGVSEKPTDGEEVYGYLWKNSRVAYIKTDGTVLKDCPDTALTIRLGVKHAQEIKREPAFGTFYFKPVGKPFVLAAIHLVPTGKRPQDEVQPLFETFQALNLPVVVAGDYNLDSTHDSFTFARNIMFKPAMARVKTSLKMKERALSKAYDNFWFRGLTLTAPARVINIYDAFPEKEQKEIYDNLSDHCPITGRFEFPE